MTAVPPRPGRKMLDHDELAIGAAWVLGSNDTGTMVTAAPKLYPHMWSWDAAFISIGLAHLDVGRAAREMETLFAAQWRDGMVPHIVFGEGTDYFPGPERWGTSELNPDAPREPRTSGICQPPVHAIAIRRIVDIGRRGTSADRDRVERFLLDMWPRVYRWHEWLAERRDPDGQGLTRIVHGWESGMDNSPRWDEPYDGVRPEPSLPAYTRRDRGVVGDDSQRPSDAEYDRYLWLVEEMRRVAYAPDEVVGTSSFLATDVFLSAVFAVASDVLAELGEECDQPYEQVQALRRWAERSRTAVAVTCDPDTGLARDKDLRSGRWLGGNYVSGFAPLLCGGLGGEAEQRLLAVLDGAEWSGYPGMLAAVPPTVSPSDAGFRPREYWRGPQWPFLNWLLYWAYNRRGWVERASALRSESLLQLADGSFAEYYEPFTGEPLGSLNQSWTAAVALDWLR